ncbi:WD40/YVTN/BNR-like repeat-containing protein [Actinophytocola sp.]|uniref:WD40/YVTN/BNR-like repeat-containing protein n=1 Tax=Actinophytocola sp. TaxID=1872138 RepID=UPI003D6BB015
MPDTDLDTKLERLRDDLRGSLPVPGFDKVVARHKQRVVRRRMQIGAVAAVLVVSVAVPLLRTQMVPEPVPPATPPPPSEPSYPKGTFIHRAEFADPEHGYVIRSRCKEGTGRCTSELLATDDGTNWTPRKLPRPDSAPSWAREDLSVLGPKEITVDWPLSATLDGTRVHRAHSVDGGATWETVSVPSVVTDRVPAIPDGGVLVESCARLVGGGKQCAERGFAVLLPGSGKSAVLENRPPLTAMLAGRVPTKDGIWWVAGRDPETDHWGLAVSDDDGRTWTTTILDWRETVSSRGWFVDSHDGILYASAIGGMPDTSNGLLGVFRSTDGGRTWQQTWRPADDKQPRRVFGYMVAGAEGLTINTPDGTAYLSRDGGRTFTETKRRYGDYAYRTGLGYVSVGSNSSRKVQTSVDGVHWRTFEVD